MNWYLKERFGTAVALREAFEREMKEHKLNTQIYQEKSHTIVKAKELPAERLLKVLKKWPSHKPKDPFN